MSLGLVPLLDDLFYLSFYLYTLPLPYSRAKISPLLKQDDFCGPNNCRQISLKLDISKVFETITSDQLQSFLERKAILRYRQYGFRQHRSIGYLVVLITALLGRQNNHGKEQLVSPDRR